jgi:hypothetical protein
MVTTASVSTRCKQTAASLRHAVLMTVLPPCFVHSVRIYDDAVDVYISCKIHEVPLPHWADYLTLNPVPDKPQTDVFVDTD